MFTQRHFEAIAEVINAELNTEQSQVGKRAVRNTAQRLAGLFRQHNERFDRQSSMPHVVWTNMATLPLRKQRSPNERDSAKSLVPCALGIK